MNNIRNIPLVVAHRGYAPSPLTQNSLSAIKLAIDMKADGIEVDVRLTEDNEPVIFHDPFFFKHGRLYWIHKLTLNEFRTFFDQNTAPTLEDVVRLIPSGIKLFVELKPYRQSLKLATILPVFLDPDGDVWLMTYRHQILQALQISGFKTGLHYINPFRNHLDYLKKFNVQIISPLYWVLPARFIHKYQKKGFMVIPWTVNRKKPIQYYVKNGVDGIYTNNLPLCQEIVEAFQTCQKKHDSST